MTDQEIVDALLTVAAEGANDEDFHPDRATQVFGDIFDAAESAFGSWPVALGAALIRAQQRRVSKRSAAAHTTSEPVVAPRTRVVSEAADYPVYLLSDAGYLASMALSRLVETSANTWRELPEGPQREAWPERLHMGDEDTTFFALASDGSGGTLHGPHFVDWQPNARPARYGDHIILADDVPVVGMFPRRHLRLAQRVYAVATDGQIKATDADLYARKLGNEAIDVILPRDGASAYTLFPARTEAAMFMASSGGKAIVFNASELRSQGLRAQGVRGIHLEDDHVTVGAFSVLEDDVVLITEAGLAKRMKLADFRPQKRGGAGLQTCKLDAGDRVHAMVQASINDDLLVIATDGQYLRIPVWKIPVMGRAARGEQLVTPPDGEALLDVCVVPAGSEGTNDVSND